MKVNFLIVFTALLMVSCGPDEQDSAGKVDSDSIKQAEIEMQQKKDSADTVKNSTPADTVTVTPIDSQTMMSTMDLLDSIMAAKKK